MAKAATPSGTGGALAQVRGQLGEGSGPVVAQVECAFHSFGEVAEGLLVTEAGEEGGAVDEGGASGELGAAHSGEQGCGARGWVGESRAPPGALTLLP